MKRHIVIVLSAILAIAILMICYGTDKSLHQRAHEANDGEALCGFFWPQGGTAPHPHPVKFSITTSLREVSLRLPDDIVTLRKCRADTSLRELRERDYEDLLQTARGGGKEEK